MTADELARLVWTWIGNHHDHSYDSGDLISDLEGAGFPCPPDLEEGGNA